MRSIQAAMARAWYAELVAREDDSLDLVDLGELASGGLERPDCMAVIMMAVDVSVSTGAASASPCTMTQISDMCAHWPRRAWK
jgi:hypothetical protein